MAAVLLTAVLLSGRAAMPTPAAAAFCDTQPAGFCATLTIALVGNGTGDFLTNDGDGVHYINCHRENGVTTGTCSHQYYIYPSGWLVPYSATPATGTCVKLNPSDICTSNSPSGIYNLTEDRSDAITFQLLSYDLHIELSGSGSGAVVGQPGSFVCPYECDRSFLYGSDVTLTAAVDTGFTFDGWTGACAGQTNHCDLTVTEALSTTAIFNVPPTPASSALPTASPKATARPATPRPTQAPPASAAASAVPSTASTLESGDPTAIPSAPGASASGLPAQPATTAEPSSVSASPAGSAAATDLTLVAVAILGAGLLIAIGIAVGLWLTRRRTAG